jgi:hypothetical protein
VYERSEKLVCHVVNSNNAINSLATLQISMGIVGLFEKVYDGKPILPILTIFSERMYNTVVSMKGIM